MEEARAIISRYPQRELEIRRLCNRDERFRSVCQDYQQAAVALRYWQGRPADNASRIEDYENFLGELEIEVLARLDHSLSKANSGNSWSEAKSKTRGDTTQGGSHDKT